jgi:hypothetical protein
MNPCHFTGSATATTIKSPSSSNLGLRSFMLVYDHRLMSLIKGTSPNLAAH